VIDAALLNAKIDYIAGKMPEARNAAREAFSRNPLLFEARLLEGRASSKIGHKLAGQGDLAGARKEYDAAEEVLIEAVQIARSDPETQFQLCRLYDRMLELPAGAGDPPSDDAAIVACRRAVRVDSENANAAAKLAIALNRRAEREQALGHDITALLAESRPLVLRAIAAQPRFVNHYRLLANTYRLAGDFDAAATAVRNGLAANPDPASAQKLELTLARSENDRGRAALAHHESAGAALTAGLAAIDRARAYGDNYRVVTMEASLRTLAAADAVAAHHDARALIKTARETIAKTVALSKEVTPSVAALTRELDSIAH
jgi:tetratricopeptide (TPR) repeat protein